MYRRAYQTFCDLSMSEAAKMVERHLARFPMAESETTDSLGLEGIESGHISEEGQSGTEEAKQPEPETKREAKPDAESAKHIEEEEEEEEDLDDLAPLEYEDGF
jgi:hypothetical protein